MMNKTICYIFKSLAVAAVLMTSSACRKTDVGHSGMPLSFSAEAVEMKAGAQKTSEANLKNKPFGVAGVYSLEKGSEDCYNVFNSSNVKVSWDGDSESWEYSPLAYWNINRYYRFRAYHPYDENDDAITVKNASGDKLTIEYSVAAGQQDLLVGSARMQATVDQLLQRVDINFQHALCGLEFRIAFNDADEIDDAYTDKITSFYLSGIVPTGTLIYSHETGDPLSDKIEWVTLDTAWDDTEFFNWESAEGKEFKKINDKKDNATIIFDQDGMVFCVPQTCSQKDKPDKPTDKPTKVNFKTKKGGSALHSAQLPELTWEPGKIYVYTLLVNKSDVTVSVTIKPWTVIESNENLFI